jgi:hypothetical protein
MTLTDHEQVILQLGVNRQLAHQVIFKSKHPNSTPDFHWEIMNLWSLPLQHALVMAFRGAGKSTLAEQAITLSACYREFRNCIILADTWTRAVEHIAKIRNEIETNVYIEGLFGSLVGHTWTDEKLVLANGVVIQALGRGQSLRGTKHLDWRPDLVFLDDVEDADSCTSQEQIAKTMGWLVSEVIPAMAPGYRLRMNGTPLHPHSVLMQLASDPAWTKKVFPVEYLDPGGVRTPSWPDRFPLSEIDRTKSFYERRGMIRQYMQEFMCVAEDAASKPFNKSSFKYEPVVRTWQNTYAVYDPARTTNKTSATTGKIVYSWSGSRLVVWDAAGCFWKPDELLTDIFDTQATYQTAAIYVEADGLNEWLMQPIRQEQMRRSWYFPVLPVKAPKGKLDFIMQLQPFFKAGEVIFTKPLPDLEQQLENFPTGRIDVPNALAYALALRPGAPVYEGFAAGNVRDDLQPVPNSMLWLAVNATTQHTTAALLQIVDGGVNVLADFIREGDPGNCLAGLVADAGVFAARDFRIAAPATHFDRRDNIGLVPAAARVPCNIYPAGQEMAGRAALRQLLTQTRRGHAALQVSSNARWTANAMAGGHCFNVDKRTGLLGADPVGGVYVTLMAGIESVAALLDVASEADDQRRYATTPDGRRYLTALGHTTEVRPSKSDWGLTLSRR